VNSSDSGRASASGRSERPSNGADAIRTPGCIGTRRLRLPIQTALNRRTLRCVGLIDRPSRPPGEKDSDELFQANRVAECFYRVADESANPSSGENQVFIQRF
jgi:hypothetical protein